MLIGVPKEIKNHEYRVGLTPSAVQLITQSGHKVHIQYNAGHAVGFTNEMYEKAGAIIVPTAEAVYDCEMVVKVKEPQASEFPLLKKGQILFCYLHLAPDPEQLKHLIEKEVVAIAYETVIDEHGRLPLLTPMSEVAGRLAVQAGATALQMAHGGKGVLLGGVPGVSPAKVVVIGGGVVGTQAAKTALGTGADVTIIERRISRLRELDDLYGPRLKTLFSTPHSIEESVTSADLVIGAVLIPGKLAPKLITRQMIQKMEPGSVFVDVAIDQGGCAETSKATTHSDPTYVVDGVIHYCVANMPGAVARTSTQALTNATLSYVFEIAQKGYKKALRENFGLKEGLNVCLGSVTNYAVANDCGYEYIKPDNFLND